MLDNKVSLHSYLKSPCMIVTAENLYLDTNSFVFILYIAKTLACSGSSGEKHMLVQDIAVFLNI